MLNVVVLAYENCLQSGIAGILDLLTLANWQNKRLNPKQKTGFCHVEVATATGDPVTSFNRQTVTPTCGLEDCRDIDLIIVPGMMGRPEALLEQRDIISWIEEQHRSGTVVASACSGAFLLAAAGILNRRPATTHWQLADRFRLRFPKVDLEIDRILIDGGDYLTAGGTSAHNDLAVELIEKYGSDRLADACARMMLIDRSQRDQAIFISFQGCREHGDSAILKVQQWLDRFFAEKVTVRVMAKKSGLNDRTFLRRFRKATGEAPLEYLQRLRVEKAKRLLRRSDHSLQQITRAVGYSDLSSFRRLFRQVVGISPTAYRKRFAG